MSNASCILMPSGRFSLGNIVFTVALDRTVSREDSARAVIRHCLADYRHDHFLEVDRSSEQLDTLVNKAICYREYYRSGGYAVRNGKSRTAVDEFPFRVLMVVKNAERRNNLAERLAHNNPAILTQTWLAAIEDVTSNPLGPIWIQPKDFRDATKGTRFYNEHPPREFAYRHQPEREAFIESKIQKLRLLAG